jgi:hypothetical protein
MSDVSESFRKKLQADTGTGGFMTLVTDVFEDIAPEGSLFPYCVVQVQSPAIPSYSFGQTKAAEESTVIAARIVDKNISSAAAEDAAAKLKTLMQDAALSIPGKTLIWCRWRSDIDFSTFEVSEIYRFKGSMWNVKVAP